MTDIDIVYTGDKNYSTPIIVSMTSVVKNLSENYHAHFHLFLRECDQDVMDKYDCAKAELNCSVTIYQMEQYDCLFNDVDVTKFGNQWINIVCYYRLLMFRILPDNIHKCFYIDGDIIVDTDLSKLYETMKENEIASVVVEVPAMQNRKTTLAHFYEWEEFSKFAKDANAYPHFNAGFFLLNVDLARKKQLWDKFVEFYKKHPNPKYADQDILNAIIGQDRPGELNILPPEYDVFCDLDYEKIYDDAYYSPDDIKRSFESPKIIHYGGPGKPWMFVVKHHFDKWFEYALQSPVKDEVISLMEVIMNDKNQRLKDEIDELETSTRKALINLVEIFIRKVRKR